MPSPSWRGQLKLSLVSCPVLLYAATTRSSQVSFHLLHPKTRKRIRMRPHDPDRGEVRRSELVKGFEYQKGQYVVLEDEDFEKAQIESNDTLNVERFVDRDEVDKLYYDTPYYMAPDGEKAEETFLVLHEAMRKEDKVGISRLVFTSREHMVAIEVRGKGFQVTTLRTYDEVLESKGFFEGIGEGAELEDEMVELAQDLLRKREGKFDPKGFQDRYQEALKEIIEAKVKGKKPAVGKAPERGKVIDLREALQRSVKGEGRKSAAKSSSRRKSGKSGGKDQKQSKGKSAKSGGAKSSGSAEKRKKAS